MRNPVLDHVLPDGCNSKNAIHCCSEFWVITVKKNDPFVVNGYGMQTDMLTFSSAELLHSGV